MLFTVNDERGRVFLEKECGVSSITESSSHDRLPHEVSNIYLQRRQSSFQALDKARGCSKDLRHHRHLLVPTFSSKDSCNQNIHGGMQNKQSGEIKDTTAILTRPVTDEKRRRPLSSMHLLRDHALITDARPTVNTHDRNLPAALAISSSPRKTARPQGTPNVAATSNPRRKHRSRRATGGKRNVKDGGRIQVGGVKAFWSTCWCQGTSRKSSRGDPLRLRACLVVSGR